MGKILEGKPGISILVWSLSKACLTNLVVLIGPVELVSFLSCFSVRLETMVSQSVLTPSYWFSSICSPSGVKVFAKWPRK